MDGLPPERVIATEEPMIGSLYLAGNALGAKRGGRLLCALSAISCLTACGDADSSQGHREDERKKYFNETSTNWSMVRGYPRGTAYNPYELELNSSTVNDLRVLWQSPSKSSPLIQSGDRVLASHVAALQAADGSTLWSLEGVESSQAGVVCKGAVYQTGDGIVATNVTSGKTVVNISPADQDEATLFGPPIAKDSKVIFAALSQDWSVQAGTRVTEYRAFDAATKLTSYVRGGFVSLSPAAVTSGQLYAPGLTASSSDGAVHWAYSIFSVPVDPADAGAKARTWTALINATAEAKAPEVGVAVIGGHVYAPGSGGHEVVSLEQRSGKLLWRKQTECAIESLATTFDYVYVAGARDDGTVIVQAFAATDGSPKFSIPLAAATLTGRLALGGDVLYAGLSDGNLYALGAATGAVIKRISLGGSVSDPIVSRARVFVANGEAVSALGVTDALGPEVTGTD